MANRRHRSVAKAEQRTSENRQARRKSRLAPPVLVSDDLGHELAEPEAGAIQLPPLQPATHTPFAKALKDLQIGDDDSAMLAEAAS